MVQSGCTLDNVIGWQKQYSPASSTLDEEREPLVAYNTPSGSYLVCYICPPPSFVMLIGKRMHC